MDKIILFLLIALVCWWIGNLAAQDQYTQILGAEVSALEMIMGIVGATVSCHLFLYTSRDNWKAKIILGYRPVLDSNLFQPAR